MEKNLKKSRFIESMDKNFENSFSGFDRAERNIWIFYEEEVYSASSWNLHPLQFSE